MKKPNHYTFTASIIFITLAVGMVTGCKDSPEEITPDIPPEIFETEDLTYTNDEDFLNQKVVIIDEILATTDMGDGGGTANMANGQMAKGTFRVVAKVNPLEKEGNALSASHVRLRNNYAYVSYNTKGGQYGGGLQILDISNLSRPKLKSEALYKDSDFNALSVQYDDKSSDDDDDDNAKNGITEFIFMAGANRKGALIEKLAIKNGKITENTESLQIKGVNCNGILLTDDMLYATVGGSSATTSGIYAIDLRDNANFFKVIDQHNYARTKDVAAKGTKHGKEMVVLTGGEDASLIFYKVNRTGLNKVSEPLPILPIQTLDGKNTAIFKGNLVYVAASEVGLAIYKKTSHKQNANWLLPQEFFGGGLTNALAVDGSMVYIANDIAGFYGATKIKKEYPDQTFKFELEGSSNYVAARKDLIVVANGTGGVTILQRMK